MNEEKNAVIISALRGGSDYVYFAGDDDYYSLIGVVIDGKNMERMPVPVLADLVGALSADKVGIAAAIGRNAVLTLPRNTDYQAGARLMQDICETIFHAEGEAWMDDGKIVVHTTVSRDPARRNNGGEYDYYRVFRLTPVGVVAQDEWSCDIRPCDEGATVYGVACDDLGPLFEAAQIIVEEARSANRVPFAPQDEE